MLEGLNLVLSLIVLAISVLLAFISWVAYRRSHLRSALYLLIAFMLFAFKKVVESFYLLTSAEREVLDATVAVFEILILSAFFLAITRER